MRVAEKLDWKGLKIKKIVGNRKIIMSTERVNSGKIHFIPSEARMYFPVTDNKITSV
jgi:hypothetical protein